ncbi:polysaccharide biosynthesis/export family protein [Planctomicrobium sp. SH664]|uniref:polysaccharide biosynthesis/export family protein n=1 Tax=Planctomicrobium sp. SH664 TaxID=3448125 RepID=UPI003F5AEC51
MCLKSCWKQLKLWSLCGAMFTSLVSSGCHFVTKACHAVPASRLDPSLFPSCKEGQVPILFTSLGQDKPEAHVVGAGDTLAVFVFGVVPSQTDETPVLQQYQSLQQRYYPPYGTPVAPTTGLPLTVKPGGLLELPLVGALDVDGLTLAEVSDKIREAYREIQVLQPGRERVSVSLIIPRVKRVVILRQDTPAEPVVMLPPGQVDHIHRGSAQVLDLPVYENDVLHALSVTGGLPGTDAAREIWVMRNCAVKGRSAVNAEELQKMLADRDANCGPSVIRIPLFMNPCEMLPFRPQDVVLDDGDVVYIPRHQDQFYVGGLLRGAQIPLPVDRDLDVVEAIALVTGSVGGPLGQSGAALTNGGPGWIIKPSRVLILRKMPDGSQLPIRVDLARAVEDPKERILIQPDDIVMLNFKPTEAVVNGALNMFGFSGIFSLDRL